MTEGATRRLGSGPAAGHRRQPKGADVGRPHDREGALPVRRSLWCFACLLQLGEVGSSRAAKTCQAYRRMPITRSTNALGFGNNPAAAGRGRDPSQRWVRHLCIDPLAHEYCDR